MFRLIFLEKLSENELEMVKDMLFNVHPNVKSDAIKNAYNCLNFKDVHMKVDKETSDLRDIWYTFLKRQDECVHGELSMKSFVLLLNRIKAIADNEGLLTRKHRQLPGYLTNFSRFYNY